MMILRSLRKRLPLWGLLSFILVVMAGPGAWGQAPEGAWTVSKPVGFQLGARPIALPDGTVLASGDEAEQAKVFDPVLGDWKKVALKEPLPSEDGATVGLPDGRIMTAVVDGTVSLYDLKSNKMTHGKTAPAILKVGFNQNVLPVGPKSACGNNCGKVLLTGVCYGAKGISLLYDIAKDSWTSPVPLIEKERCHHISTVLRNGKVLLAGGDNGDGSTIYETAEIFDPVTNTLAPTGSFRYARSHPVAVLLANGKVLAMGAPGTECSDCAAPKVPSKAKSVEIYDPKTGVWTETGETKEALDNKGGQPYAATILGNTKVLLVSGSAPQDHSAELYDPATATWSYAAPLAAPVGGAPTAILLNKKPCGDNCGKVLLISQDGTTQMYTPTGDRKAEDARSSQTRASATPGSGAKSGPPILLIGAAGLIVLAAAVGIALRRRSRSE